jgi:hypothetical protein
MFMDIIGRFRVCFVAWEIDPLGGGWGDEVELGALLIFQIPTINGHQPALHQTQNILKPRMEIECWSPDIACPATG